MLRKFNRHVGALTLVACLLPYLGLLIYLLLGMHAKERLGSVPPTWVLLTLALVGGVLPSLGITLVVRRLVKDRNSFNLWMLLEAYASLILLFASAYALLQVGSIQVALSGMTPLWKEGVQTTLSEHLITLHEVFYDALYLSIMTITTVGYGDLTPASFWAKALTALEGLAGIGFMGIALGHYFSVCVHSKQ